MLTIVPNTPPDLWPHQENGLAFIKGKTGAMLNMAMGTGKSAVVVEIMSYPSDHCGAAWGKLV